MRKSRISLLPQSHRSSEAETLALRTRRSVLFTAAGLTLGGCASKPESQAAIKFTRVPQADPGGRDQHDIIEGHVTGNLPGEQIVLYARSRKWWVQPLVDRPFTTIQHNKFTSATHMGTEYAALLVKPGFQPKATLEALPQRGGLVTAVAIVKGGSSPPSPLIRFSGYEWRVRDVPSSRGGKINDYDSRNVTVDADGALHLRITKSPDRWSCSEVSLSRSLGYGTYSFTVRDTSSLQPAAVFGMFTWDYALADQNYSEVDIEITRWGDPANKNAQYVVQPHYVPANVVRFNAPPGVLTHSFHWEPGRITFRTSRPSERGRSAAPVAEHVFTAGIPTPAIESARMNLYVYGNSRVPFENSAEVTVEKFEYLP